MKTRDVAIIGYYETKLERRSGRSVYDLAGEAAAGALAHAGVEKREIDGVAVNSSLTGAGEPFWSNRICDALGLTPRGLQTTDLGGASAVGGVARAATMIRAGWCTTALVLGTDAPRTAWGARYGSYRPEFEQPYGVQGPPGLFGFLQRRYAEQYPLQIEALAKIAIVQHLPEGTRMMAQLLNCPIERVRIGLPVRAVWEKLTDEISLPQFEPEA